MIRRPPRSTLFPYTDALPICGIRAAATQPAAHWNALGNAQADTLPGTAVLLDRKSTRLNSSHLVISYAVFCLKKKKKDRFVQCATGIPKTGADIPTRLQCTQG